ncbi:putative F-box domain-containing protein [Helianthus annuus]|uniref:F-box domain-containing protein n=1 Tax=Helianthus annuus TaxID=4232 RepID=A0A9K3MWN8_HELAN|nr:putative F-box protein At3g21120 [Helianthus annuus]KAF5778550.1 putative F-box domain-containing protein [Helianthus annuus]KAJ0489945.1 putative F-box domain-containing protein [Helianthus annuus]KAJ0493981.1 putative F-box domain-containing protein [Helianthus annuus]KAJ0505855.1 putative F-box domain-containing protein [Helianthus annuus]KAJ0675530.1 putative F-box domain-containing protein [Helianthus annuus]
MEAIDFDTLVVEVLSRLPAKSICQFKCVCKAWCAELSSNQFAILHCVCLNKAKNQKLISLNDMSIDVDNVISGKIEFGSTKSISFPFETPPLSLRFLSSLDGLLLVYCIRKLILWNPTTNWYTILSEYYPIHGYAHEYDTGAIYYDQFNDLKVLHIKRRYNNVFASVYSRRFGIWRDVEFINTTNFGSSSYAWSVGTLSAKTVYFIVSQSWWVIGKKFIVAFDVLSETFRLINFPLTKDLIPSQGHLITLNRNIHMFVVSQPEELIVELFKLEGEVWHKVLSFQHSQIVSFQSRRHQPHIMEYNTRILMSDWGHMVTVKLTGEELHYLQDVDTFNGVNGALFIETIISPFS